MAINKYLAEFMGTFILVFLGSLSILAAAATGAPLILVVALGFGLALLAAIWAVGHVSGAHFNPAVTLGMMIDGRISLSDAIGYWVAQFAGAVIASLAILAASDSTAVASTMTGYTSLGTAILVEIALTAIFVWTILAVTKTGGQHAPIAIALTLTAVHLGGIPFSGSSVNPARSFGPAVVAGDWDQLWVYLVFPLVGGVVAWALYRLFPPSEG